MAPPTTQQIVRDEINKASQLSIDQIRAIAQDELNQRFTGVDGIVTFNTLTAVLSNFVPKDKLEIMIQHQLNQILTHTPKFVTRTHFDRTLTDYVRRDRLDGTVTPLVQSKVYELLATQTGLQTILKEQSDQLRRTSASILIDTERQMDHLTDRVVTESLRSDSGSKLVNQLRRSAEPGPGFYLSIAMISMGAGMAGAAISRLF